MDLFFIIVLLGIVQGFFIGFVLINKNKKNLKDRILGLFFIVISIAILNFLFRFLQIYKSYPFLNKFMLSELFLVGPFFYFYIKALIVNNFSFSIKKLSHFIPFVIVFSFNIIFYLLVSFKVTFIIKPELGDYPYKLISLLQFIHVFVYIYLAAKNIWGLDKNIKMSLSEAKNINFKIINLMISAMGMVFGMGLIFYFIWIFDINIYNADNIIIPILVTLIIFFIGYLTLRQPEFINIGNEILKIKKYEKSALTREKSEEEFGRLLLFMEEEKPFLNNELTLIKLSDMISLSPHHLSQIINENINQNFFDFINRYRIEEAKKRLVANEYKSFTIIAIAMDSGFNSKSAFNSAFKKITGKTPSDYREELRRSQKVNT